MDSILPGQVLSELELGRRAARRVRRRHLVVAGPRRHPIVELSEGDLAGVQCGQNVRVREDQSFRLHRRFL